MDVLVKNSHPVNRWPIHRSAFRLVAGRPEARAPQVRFHNPGKDETMSDPKTTIASYVSSGGLIIFGMNANDFAVVVGVILAIATFLLNWFYKHQHLKLIEGQVSKPPFPKLIDQDGDD